MKFGIYKVHYQLVTIMQIFTDMKDIYCENAGFSNSYMLIFFEFPLLSVVYV